MIITRKDTPKLQYFRPHEPVAEMQQPLIADVELVALAREPGNLISYRGLQISWIFRKRSAANTADVLRELMEAAHQIFECDIADATLREIEPLIRTSFEDCWSTLMTKYQLSPDQKPALPIYETKAAAFVNSVKTKR